MPRFPLLVCSNYHLKSVLIQEVFLPRVNSVVVKGAELTTLEAPALRFDSREGTARVPIDKHPPHSPTPLCFNPDLEGASCRGSPLSNERWTGQNIVMVF